MDSVNTLSTIFNESLSLNSEKSMTIGVNDDMKKQHYVNEENWTENLLKNQNEEKGERQWYQDEMFYYKNIQNSLEFSGQNQNFWYKNEKKKSEIFYQSQKGEAQMYNQRNLSDAWYQYRESGGQFCFCFTFMNFFKIWNVWC